MKHLDRRFLRHFALVAVATLIATAGSLGAQSTEQPAAEEPQAQTPTAQEAPQSPEQKPDTPPPVPQAVPQITGTVVRFSGSEIDLKTKDGKEQKVAVNEHTTQLVEIEKGAEVTVEYRRKIGAFVIAERVLAAGAAPAVQPIPAPELKTTMATGEILSASDASLVLRTDQGDVTFVLVPTTEILIQPLTPGLRVTVEYREDKELTKVATRVFAAKSEEPETPSPANPPSD